MIEPKALHRGSRVAILGGSSPSRDYRADDFIQAARDMLVFSVGEVFSTLGKQPFITRRIPATHRGRIASVNSITSTLFQAVAQKGVGALADRAPITVVWEVITAIGAGCVGLYALLGRKDRRAYPALYEKAAEQEPGR